MKLKTGVWCKLHRSYYCCGRDEGHPVRPYHRDRHRPRYGEPKSKKWQLVRWGEWHQVDVNHPRGYRVRLSKARMTSLLNDKVGEQGGLCSICEKPLEDMRNVGPDHKEPSSMGGSWRDDHPENIGAAHNSCNCEKGSKRIA